jgi:hypothetical protein
MRIVKPERQMTVGPAQYCPLCHRWARYSVHRHGTEDWKHFSCPFCLEFMITGEAESLLRSKPELSMSCSDLARATPAQMILAVHARRVIKWSRRWTYLASGYVARDL